MSPAANDIRTRIQNVEGHLTEVERRLGEALLADPVGVSYQSAQEIADKTGVHQTSVIRFARKLGFSGFREMRGSLRSLYAGKADSASRLAARLERNGQRTIAQTFLESEVVALERLATHIVQADIERAASATAKASTCFIYGRGQARIVADLMASRLVRMGFAAHSFAFVDVATPQQIAQLRKDDTLIAFALRRVPEQLPMLISYCSQRLGTSVVISDMIGPSIRPQPDVLLAAPRGAEAEWQSLSVPMAIANILLLEITRRRQSVARAALELIDCARIDLDAIRKTPTRQR